ncbi:hypothetical protein ACFQ36_03470 [Arthrobacter sp. GCM10027362]|uniref:hypothetical protein n=1 Tax=Arthrobacter sp. GCM10027362 TaxID=3273379 RepID=UPI00363F537D
MPTRSRNRTGASAPPPSPLDAFRGPNPPGALTARGITATLEMPGCLRRAVFDAAGIGLDTIAPVLGCPRGEQAQHAFSRGNTFEERVMANGCAELLALLRAHLGLDISQVRVVDLSAQQVRADHGRANNSLRATLTRQHLIRMLSGDPSAAVLLRHAMTTLQVGSRMAYLEQDALAVVTDGTISIIEVKSFPKLDGRADPGKADAAARQSAVYVLSLIDTVVDDGFDPDVVSMRGLLVLPENFGLNPVANVIDLTTRVNRLRQQLADRPSDVQLAALLPPGLALPRLPHPTKATDAELKAIRPAVATAFSALPAHFSDGCLACPAFRFCREETVRTGAVAQLGSTVSTACGNVTSIGTALALAHGDRAPDDEAEEALAEHLQRAVAVRSRAVS